MEVTDLSHLNPIALRMAKIRQSFGCSECSKVKKMMGIQVTQIRVSWSLDKILQTEFSA